MKMAQGVLCGKGVAVSGQLLIANLSRRAVDCQLLFALSKLLEFRSMAVAAVQHVRRMRGGAQAHLLRAADSHFYVVKFQNNPQHLRVLANELLATRLAERIGLPVPVTEIVQVDEWLIQNTPELRMENGGNSNVCQSGLQFGARYVCGPTDGQVFDYLPESMLASVRGP